MSVSGSSSGTELNLWTRSMDMFLCLTRAEGRKEAVDCVENNWFDAQHTLALPLLSASACHVGSRLCIAHSGLHRDGHNLLTMLLSDDTSQSFHCTATKWHNSCLIDQQEHFWASSFLVLWPGSNMAPWNAQQLALPVWTLHALYNKHHCKNVHTASFF